MNILRAMIALSIVGLSGADEPTNLKGEWSLVSLKIGGQLAPPDLIAGFISTFDTQKYTNRVGDKTLEEGSYHIDASKMPAAIDFAITKGPQAGKKQSGIYRLDGDTLTLCVSDAGTETRPTTLEPPAGTAFTVVVLKRVKP